MSHGPPKSSRNSKQQQTTCKSPEAGKGSELEEQHNQQDPYDNSSGERVPEEIREKARPGLFCTALSCNLIYTFEKTLESGK